MNAVSGIPANVEAAAKESLKGPGRKNKTIQDYMTVPGQDWLDGIATSGGVVRQFVATRVGDGYNVEAQVTGQEAHGGLQFEITPAVIAAGPVRLIAVKCLTSKKMSFQVIPKTLVGELKAGVERKEGIPPDQQRLMVEGRQLSDGEPCLPKPVNRGLCGIGNTNWSLPQTSSFPPASTLSISS